MNQLNHPILEQSFAIIDAEIGSHNLNPWEYAIARRVIHTTADFEFANLLYCSSGAIEGAILALRKQTPIVTDVTMVRQGIRGMVEKTFHNPIICAIEQCQSALPGQTRTATGMLTCLKQYPQAIYVIGNAPTALLALCGELASGKVKPTLVIGVPVGFVAVEESKQALMALDVPQIVIRGRKGGSPVAAAILNALLCLEYSN